MASKSSLGVGSFSDRYDNERSRSIDRDHHLGGVTNTPFEDDMDLETNDFFPDHGEGHYAGHRREGPRDADLARGEEGTSWNLSYGNESDDLDLTNLARSDLRPDLHPERNFYGRGPQGWKKSDSKLKEDVSEALHHSMEVDASDLEVKVEEGCVYLKGTIQSEGMRRVAEDLVGSVPGVIDVFTRLKVKRSWRKHR